MQDVVNIIAEKKALIEDWFTHIENKSLLITSSSDIRNAGFKIVPVDTNVFPAGFNNLHEDAYPFAAQMLSTSILSKYKDCKNILLLPESHTRNAYYYENIAVILSLLEKAGFNAKVGSLVVKHPCQIQLPNGQKITLNPLKKVDNKLVSNDFIPDLLLLNNDLSDGIPALLEAVEQPIEPALSLGWYIRSKATHFKYYQTLADEFAKMLSIDPWQISPLTFPSEEVDFMERSGLDCIAHHACSMFSQIKKKYQEHQINSTPFIMLKADAGTYGMAVIPIHDPKEIYHLNRKKRLTMSVRKGGQKVNKIIIQEGVPSIEKSASDNAIREPVIYMIGGKMVGAFYRSHPARTFDDNLSAPGMRFEKLTEQEINTPLFYAYSVIARLASLATKQEVGT